MVPLFQEFCFDFGFDIQDCLLLYLQTVVKTWNPKLNINNYNGKKGKKAIKKLNFNTFTFNIFMIVVLELHIDENEVNELRKKCNTIATYITDKVALKNSVTSVLSQV